MPWYLSFVACADESIISSSLSLLSGLGNRSRLGWTGRRGGALFPAETARFACLESRALSAAANRNSDLLLSGDVVLVIGRGENRWPGDGIFAGWVGAVRKSSATQLQSPTNAEATRVST